MKRYDGVIEVVRYTPEGKISTVRMYERRGATYSDRVLVKRADLLQRLRAGKKLAVGVRTISMASTFEVRNEVRLAGSRGQEWIVAGKEISSGCDDLQGAPIF